MSAGAMAMVYLGDCQEYMKGLKDNEIDLIITDPPYGIGIGKMGYVKSRHGGVALRTNYAGQGNWDVAPAKEVFDEMIRVSKNQIIFGGQYFTGKLPQSNCWLVWDKKVEEKYSNDFADCELMWTSFTKPPKIYRYLWHGMIQHNMKDKEKRQHPTQKPVGLIKKLILDFAQNDFVIYDPFAGSGSTIKAAFDLGYDAFGSEIDPHYVDIANKRLEQGRLL